MTQNPKFAAVLTLEGDFVSTAWAIQAAHREQQAIIAAIRERISAERKRADDRAAELRATIADSSRSETVRGLAAGELRELETAVYAPTLDEKAAFEAATKGAEQALRDLTTTQRALHDALAAARAELEQIKATTTGKVEIDLLQRWICSAQDDFLRMEAER